MDLRRTGIETIGDVPWGTHFCNFYQTRADLLDILVPYFKAGLEDNEFCMWITAEPLGVDDAIKAMQKALPDFDGRLARGQIEILPYDEWYLRGGSFDAGRVLEGWLDKLDAATVRGYNGLRLTGNTFWLEKKDWDSFLAYEDQVNNVIGKYRILAICTYSLKKCDASEVIDVVNTHQFALAKRDGKWDRLENTQRTEAERRVRARLEQALSPDGDIGKLELSDIIDAGAIQALMEEFNKLVRIPMAVIDLKGKTLVGVGWQDVCTKFHRLNPKTCKYCVESDTKLAAGVEPGEVKLYRCKNGLWDAATPLIVGGRRVGNLFMGQFFFEDENLDYDLFRSQARMYGFNEDEYLAALERVPRLSRDAVNTAMSYCARLAHMISQLSYSNIKLARTLAQGEALNASLRESRELLAVTLASIGDGVIMTDCEGNVTYLNGKAEHLTGWKNDEAQGLPLEKVFNIINEESREPVESPVKKVLREGAVVGLANHTVLIAKDEREMPIDDSGAPIRSADGALFGVVLIFRDFSQQRKAEAEIRSLARFPEENPNVVLRATADGRLLYANNPAMAVLKSMGWKKGSPMPEALRRAAGITQGQKTNQEFELVLPSNRVFSFMLTPIPDEGYSNLYGRDVTDRKRAEQDLQASLERYRSFLDVTGQVGWTTNAGGEVIEEIPAWSKFTGQNAEEIKGWGWAEAVHPDDVPRTREVWTKAVRERKPYETEYRLRRHDGVYRHFLARGIPVLDDAGEVREWVGTCIDITEHKQAEQELRRNREDLNRAQEVAHTGSWRLDVRTNELTWSDENHRIFGIPPGTKMTYETFLSCVHPDDRKYVDERWNAGLRGEPYDIEHRIIAVGRTKWVREKAYLEFSADGRLLGGFGTTQDITASKEAEEALRESRGRFQQLVETATEGIWEVDREFRTTYVNGRMAEMLGYKPDEVVGRLMSEFTPPEEHEDLRRRIENRLRGLSETYERRLRRKDGSIFWAMVSGSPLRGHDGRIRGSFGMFTDITDRKHAEEERQRLLEQLESKNSELQSIVYVASHDLRSPLVNVAGFAGQLTEEWERLAKMVEEEPDIAQLRRKARDILEKDIPEYLNFIKAGSQKMQMVINGLLTISRLGNAQLNIAPLDMNRLINHIVTSMTFEIQSRGAQVEAEELPPCMGDATQINRLFSNLLSNALKYLDPDRKGLIRVTGKVDGAMSVYSVSDNGVGIAANHKEKIFEIFHRLNPNDGIAGDGLGLSIVMRILDRHNGRVWVDSEPGKGSTFHVALPTLL
jgi:PAS domain S-box-containing protein